MRLGEAYKKLLGLTKSTDNARTFKETYLHFNKTDEDDLKTYLEFVCDNCEDWFHALPDKLASEAALAKPKSAIIKLISEEDVRGDLGADFCSELEQTLASTWRAKKVEIVDSRKGNKVITGGELDKDMHSENNDHVHSQSDNHKNHDELSKRFQRTKDIFLLYVKNKEPDAYEFMKVIIESL